MDNQEETLHGALEAAFDAATTGNDESDGGFEVEQVEQPKQSDRARDESGKFAKVEKVNDAEIPAAKEGAPTVPDELIPEQPAAPAVESKRAPSSWKKGASDKFATLDADIQDEILRRETDFHKGIESFKGHADFGKRIEQTLAPYQETFKKLNVDGATAISELMKTDDILRHAPPSVKYQKILELASHFGIDLNQQFDPNIARYEAEMHQLRQQNQEILRNNQSREFEAVNTTIGQFAQQPGHEHFEQVREHMASLLDGGQAKDLQEAYDQAVYANPATRNALLEQERRKVADDFNAKRAKAAGSSVKGSSPSSGSAPTQHDSIRASLAAAWDNS